MVSTFRISHLQPTASAPMIPPLLMTLLIVVGGHVVGIRGRLTSSLARTSLRGVSGELNSSDEHIVTHRLRICLY
jgi:hypothetical protein